MFFCPPLLLPKPYLTTQIMYNDTWYYQGMKKLLFLAPMLLLILLQTACATPSFVPSTTLVQSSPTPVPTTIPTVQPLNPPGAAGFDTQAGNCLDAANQAIILIKKAANGDFAGTAFTTDMSMDLEPHDSRCMATGHMLNTYQQYVASVRLQVWMLDNNWYYAAATTRQSWLETVLHYLLGTYTHAGLNVRVFVNDKPCGSASIGPGQAGTPSVVSECS